MPPAPESLPSVLPVFPLTGVLLLPGNVLPLHAFEPRYRALVEDALVGDRMIGMIQPRVAGPDHLGAVPGAENPPLHSVGCAGRILDHRLLPEGRHLVVLEGCRRFRVARELCLYRGYRQVVPDWEPFAGDDGEVASPLDTGPLLAALASLEERCGVRLEHNRLDELAGARLLNLLAAQLPFRPVEKQALLEAATVEERSRVLLALLAMGLAPQDAESYHRPPVLN